MRCAVIEKFGNPADVLLAGERPLPEPGPGEVRLRLILSPIHNHDLWTIRGEYGYKPPLPYVPGTEAVGRVDALGEGVSGLVVGQRVSVGGINGAWAEHFLARAGAVVPVPEALPDEAACQLLAMPLSAAMLMEDLALQPGQWMIQNTANGAVGRVVNALAKARGVHVVNLVRSSGAAASLRATGVGHVLATDDPGWKEAVAALCGDAPIVRAVDSVGGRAANDLLDVLAVGGTLVSFGAMAGSTLDIDVNNVIFKQTTIRGFWGAKRRETTPAADRARMVGEIIRLVLDGALDLSVHQRFGLADAAGAAAASATPNRSGKIALQA